MYCAMQKKVLILSVVIYIVLVAFFVEESQAFAVDSMFTNPGTGDDGGNSGSQEDAATVDGSLPLVTSYEDHEEHLRKRYYKKPRRPHFRVCTSISSTFVSTIRSASIYCLHPKSFFKEKSS